MSNKIKNATKVLFSLGLLLATSIPVNAAKAPTKKYRIDAQAEITGCFDGILDDYFVEVFSEAHIDSVKVGGVARDRAESKGCGQRVQILRNYTHTTNNPYSKLNLKLFDRDRVNSDDKLGQFEIPLTGNSTYTVNRDWGSRGSNGEGSKISVTVTPISQPVSRVNRVIRVSDGNKKIIGKNGEFWVNNQYRGTGKWISSTRYVVFVKDWGRNGIWWVGDLIPEGMRTTAVKSEREVYSARTSNLERFWFR